MQETDVRRRLSPDPLRQADGDVVRVVAAEPRNVACIGLPHESRTVVRRVLHLVPQFPIDVVEAGEPGHERPNVVALRRLVALGPDVDDLPSAVRLAPEPRSAAARPGVAAVDGAVAEIGRATV